MANPRVNLFFYSFLIILLLLLGYLTFMIIEPFLSPLAWAIVLAIIFYPFYVLVLKYLKIKQVASLVTVIVILVVLLGPFSYFSFMLVNEIKDLAQHLEAGHYNVKDILGHPKVSWLLEQIRSFPPFKDLDVQALLLQTFANIRAGILNVVTIGAKNIIQIVVEFFIMLFTVFFLIKDGPDFTRKIKGYLPFSQPQKDRLEKQIKDMVISTIYGGVVVAMVQGLIGGIAFWALGISSYVLWGSAMFMTSFVPAVGTMVIWGPAAIYFFVKGDIVRGIVLTLIGALIISSVDNILKPIIISGRVQMHTILIFFSVLGGIAFFGLIGLVMGPLTVALFISVLDIFGNLEKGGPDAESSGT